MFHVKHGKSVRIRMYVFRRDGGVMWAHKKRKYECPTVFLVTGSQEICLRESPKSLIMLGVRCGKTGTTVYIVPCTFYIWHFG